jgi:hypothetical protein
MFISTELEIQTAMIATHIDFSIVVNMDGSSFGWSCHEELTMGPLRIRIGQTGAPITIPCIPISTFTADLLEIVLRHTITIAKERTVRFNFIKSRPYRGS